ncbi:hypothetical protein FNO01nite_08570 [Flavobacterium noncentrifugens]|nr:hypothetical protein [Flavobacterium noncentrifugens]GEP50185.1 hypothetical protein FNO01nite_08570 [Flavobacterium noncentrifugens]
MKNKGLYVGFNKKWFSPNRVVEKEFNLALKETELIRSAISNILKIVLDQTSEELDITISELQLIKKEVISKINSRL